jgi:hypothetical protein
MLNDVHPPPLPQPVRVALNETRNVSETPIPPPQKTVADVTLFDHPAVDPTGAGNFWGLAIIGMIAFGFVAAIAMFLWVVRG